MCKILVVYTGGTIGMSLNKAGVLVPYQFAPIQKVLNYLFPQVSFSFVQTPKIKDSSEMKGEDFSAIASCIQSNYLNFEAFLVLHGTDTLTYSASACSFLLQKLTKPVVFTGAQFPLYQEATDAIANLTFAIKVLVANRAEVKFCEVAIAFHYTLFRANRCVKLDTTDCDAFGSPNYPILAREIDGELIFYPNHFLPHNDSPQFYQKMNDKVGLYIEYPTIHPATFEAIFDSKNYDAVIMELYGTGNFQSSPQKITVLKNYIQSGGIVVVLSQCLKGGVKIAQYQSGNYLIELSVLSGANHTRFALFTKLMFLLANFPKAALPKMIQTALAGECDVLSV